MRRLGATAIEWVTARVARREIGGEASVTVTVGVMSMTGLDPSRETAENYRAFARLEAAGLSPAYETLASAVAGDDVVLSFLSTVPAIKRQPNLLFAAARLLLDDTPDIQGLRDLVQLRAGDLSAVMLARRTQTNEVGRCATLLPALARLPGPLALIEVGASAGLALLIDRYSYDYDGHVLHGTEGAKPLLRCHVEGSVPIPNSVPESRVASGPRSQPARCDQ